MSQPDPPFRDAVEAIPTEQDFKRATEVLLTSAMSGASQIKLDAKDVGNYYHGLLRESDRAAGILAFAFIESQITEIFSQHIDPSIQGGIATIIGQSGILNTVSARLKMLRALYWLRQETYGDLRLLASIRNRFAHSHTALTFDDDKIRGHLSTLRKHEEKYGDKYDPSQLSTKQIFLVRSVMTLFELYADLVLMPASLKAGLGPRGGFSAGFDRFPGQLRESLTYCTFAVRLICEH